LTDIFLRGKMGKFKYKFRAVTIDQLFNNTSTVEANWDSTLGDNRWELVQILRDGADTLAIFKRRKE